MVEWYTNPSWWEAIGTIGATILFLFYNILDRHWNRAIIEVSCGNEEPYCRQAMEVGSRLAYFIRLEVRNTGKSLAKNCEGKVNKIYDPVTKKELTPFDPVVLSWVGHRRGPININSGEYEYLDLLKTYLNDMSTIHTLAEDLTARGIIFHPEMKDWIFEISIYGENVKPVSKSYKFTKADTFDEVKIEECTCVSFNRAPAPHTV